ncbi:helix-turn-helix domain-containing protein [Agaribacter marinus]|uniref:Helix-turn-helix transcriptional regulator n=1 Tax=Virgibacillus salarius TaxID=447199 RepID=A0A941ICV2_9BACI|nr:helix-turn-helix transcriptional regulator [Virgibacillus salarius]MBR7797896.1 helix-turn-helix transcriptional regulator [Virgibacillus salarius]NAZ10606.1 helix-turn-helix domain-containing protein [Agaribacter marinus]
MSDFLKLVGNNIRMLRKEQGLTQEELAEKAELQHSYIGGIERGERNISLLTMEKIIIALNISPRALFDYNGIEITNSNQIIKAHEDFLKTRDIEEIKSIHKIVKEITGLIDSKKKK